MEEGSPSGFGDIVLSVFPRQGDDIESGTAPPDRAEGGGIEEWLKLKKALYPEWASEQEYILHYISQAREWHGLPAEAGINRYMLTYNMIELHNYSAVVGTTVVQYCMPHPHPLRRLIGPYHRPYCNIPLYRNGIDVVVYDEAPVVEGIDNIIGLAEKYGIAIEQPTSPIIPEGQLPIASNEIRLTDPPPPSDASLSTAAPLGPVGGAEDPPEAPIAGYGPKPHRDKKGD